MADHGIIFTGPSIPALLDGRKTQTRRVIAASNSTVLGYRVGVRNPMWAGLDFEKATVDHGFPDSEGNYPYHYLHVPFCEPGEDYGGLVYRVRSRWEPGDTFWVKETWRCTGGGNHKGIAYRGEANLSPPAYKQLGLDALGRKWLKSKFHAECSRLVCETTISTGWRSPRFMPRWASRITLELTDVRVQQVQDISEEDAFAEDAPEVSCDTYSAMHEHPRDDFRVRWNFLNAKRGYPWSAEDLPENWPKDKPLYGNPWVWALTFTRRKP